MSGEIGQVKTMLDVMIIDDDKTLRKHLKSMIEWDRFDLRLVCEAGDSETARELYLLHRPKIIVTDINIPIISGLELARELAKSDREIRFIVITAYSDFEYVRDSVELGAVTLLSKPLKTLAVNEALEKAVSYFDELKAARTSSNALMQLLDDNLPELREKYVAKLLTSGINGYSHYEIAERMHQLGIMLPGQYFAVTMLVVEALHIRHSDMESILAALKNITGEMLDYAGYMYFLFYDGHYRLNCAVSFEHDKGCEQLEETLSKVYEQMAFLFELRVFAGIGGRANDLSGLSTSAEQALIALSYQNVIGSGTIINYQNIAMLDSPERIGKQLLRDTSVRLFRQNRMPELAEQITVQFDAALCNSDPLTQAREYAFECVSAILMECFSLGVGADALSGFSAVFEGALTADNIISLRRNLLDFIETLQLLVLEKRSSSNHRLIHMAKVYLSTHLSDDKLCLDAVSNHVGLSSIYFCKLFHKEEGVSFNDYLNSLRIDRAKELLVTTNKKVYEISSETGYASPKYFSYVFKRLTGVTPLEYSKL